MLELEHHADWGLLRQIERMRPALRGPDRLNAMIVQHPAGSFARSLGPAGDDDALALCAQGFDVARRFIEHVHAIGFALGREIPPRPRSKIDRPVLSARERGELAGGARRQAFRPFLFIQIKRIGRERAIGRGVKRSASALPSRRAARLMIVRDQLETLSPRLNGEVIKPNHARRADIVEHRLKALVEER